MSLKYPHLFSPLTVRGKTFKNRILLAPMGIDIKGAPGMIGQETIDFYERVAEGGAARIVGPENDVEFGSAVAGHYWYFMDEPPQQLLDETVKYVEACHKNGALAFMHFGYMGAYGRDLGEIIDMPMPPEPPADGADAPPPSEPGDMPSMEEIVNMLKEYRPNHPDGTPYRSCPIEGPSEMILHQEYDGVTSNPAESVSGDGTLIHEMTEERMHEVADAFAHCAAVVKSCGMDGMTIHSGHGFIFGQWISKRFNHRTDQYGGSPENCARFPAMVLRRIREAVGEDFIIEMRFSPEEGLEPITDKQYIPDVVTLKESVAFFRELDKEPGLLDIVHVSGGLHTEPVYNTRVIANSYFPMGLNLAAAAEIKRNVKNIKVAVVGSMGDPKLCEEAIAEGKTDFVIMCRQLMIADPDFPKKAQAGDDILINNCLRCTSCRPGGRCAVNPGGPEGKGIPKTKKKRKVIVAGGGIAGMTAAEYAAEAGHEVTLYEKTDRLGGILTYTDHVADKSDICRWYHHVAERLPLLGVDVKIKTPALPQLLKQEGADVILVAAGGKERHLPIEIPADVNYLTAMEAHRHPERLKGKIAVIGGGLTGCELTIELKKQGYDVVLVSRSPKLMKNVKPRRPADGTSDTHLIWLDLLQAEIYKGWACIRADAGSIEIQNTQTQETKVIAAGTVIDASGIAADPAAAEAFSDCAPVVIPIGDCLKGGLIADATRNAYDAVCSLG